MRRKAIKEILRTRDEDERLKKIDEITRGYDDYKDAVAAMLDVDGDRSYGSCSHAEGLSSKVTGGRSYGSSYGDSHTSTATSTAISGTGTLTASFPSSIATYDPSLVIKYRPAEHKDSMLTTTEAPSYDFSVQNVLDMQAAYKRWVGDDGKVTDFEDFKKIPRVAIRKTAVGIKEAIEALDWGEKPSEETLVLRAKILETVEAFIK